MGLLLRRHGYEDMGRGERGERGKGSPDTGLETTGFIRAPKIAVSSSWFYELNGVSNTHPAIIQRIFDSDGHLLTQVRATCGFCGQISALGAEKPSRPKCLRHGTSRYGINIIANKGRGVKRLQTSRLKGNGMACSCIASCASPSRLQESAETLRDTYRGSICLDILLFRRLTNGGQ